MSQIHPSTFKVKENISSFELEKSSHFRLKLNGWTNYKLDDDVKMPEGQESANLIWTFIKQTRSGTTDTFTPQDIFNWESNLKKCLKNNIEVVRTEDKILRDAR